MYEPQSVEQALRKLAVSDILGMPTDPIVVASLDQLLLAADAERVLPHVYRAVIAGRIHNVSDLWVDRLRDWTMSSAETTLAAHAAAMRLIKHLKEIGIDDAIVLKGCATAQIDYDRPALRFSSDVDVLVPGDVLDEVLGAFGQLDRPPERSSTWNQRYGKAATLTGSIDVDLDVHVRLAKAYVGLSIPPDELRATTVGFEIGGVSMRALDGPNRLIHAALHARSANVGMHSKRDVPQLALVSKVDYHEAIRRARRWRIDHFLAVGIITAWNAFELPSHPLAEWAAAYNRPADRRQRWAMRLAETRGRGEVMAGPLALPIRDWPGYLGPLLFPTKEYAQANNKGWRTRLRIVTEEIRKR